MRKNTFRLGVNPSSFYLAQFDECELRADGSGKAVNTLVGHGDLEYEYFTLDDALWRHRGMDLPWMASWREKKKPALLAVDAAYGETHSAAAGVYLPDWTAATAIA